MSLWDTFKRSNEAFKGKEDKKEEAPKPIKVKSRDHYDYAAEWERMMRAYAGGSLSGLGGAYKGFPSPASYSSRPAGSTFSFGDVFDTMGIEPYALLRAADFMKKIGLFTKAEADAFFSDIEKDLP